MRNVLLAAAVTTAAFLLLGCPFLKKSGDADAGSDAAVVGKADGPAALNDAAIVEAAAPTAQAPVNASNAGDVARFPAETAVTDDDLRLASVAAARTSPKTGTLVATLKPGTDVVKIAEYQSSILVTFADPKGTGATLMGWIGKESFSGSVATVRRDAGAKDAAAPVAGAGGAAAKLACPAGMVSVVLFKDPVCRKRCTKDANCKGGAAGTCANATTAAGGIARVCASAE